MLTSRNQFPSITESYIPTQHFFSNYFAVTLLYTFQDCSICVYIRFTTSGKVFDSLHFNTKSKTFQILVRELLYADDTDIVVSTEKICKLLRTSSLEHSLILDLPLL